MTHIVFITPYYPPEKAAPAVRISETATRLVRRGYEVTVLTTVPSYPTGIVPPEYRGRLVQEEMCDGVRVVRVWSYTRPNRGFFRRILSQLSFAYLAPLLAWGSLRRPNVVIVESPPLFDAIAGRLVARYSRCPFIFVVSDLWPESAVQLGVLRNRLLIRLAIWLERSTYRRASLVWAITKGIRDTLIEQGVPPEKVFLLPNGVDTSKFRPLSQAQARAELGWDDRFTVLYAGTHGLAHGLITILEAAEQIRDRPDIRIVLVGDGAAKADLVRQAQQRGLANVMFLEAQPHDRMSLLLAGTDVCLVPLKKIPLFEGALPSKMYEAMACARPIILGVAGEARYLAEFEAKSAIAVEPEDAASLVSAILYLHSHPEEVRRLGQQGRAFVETRFDRDHLVAELDEHLRSLLKKNSAAPVSARLASKACRNMNFVQEGDNQI